MSNNPKLAQAFALIEQAVAEEGERAVAAFIARVSTASTTPAPNSGRSSQQKKRAPKGSAKMFVDRVLKSMARANHAQIMRAAATPEEKKISPATVRKVLISGKNDGYYTSEGGTYSLTK